MNFDLDTLQALLYLGKLSRDSVNYANTPKGKDPDHTWSGFKKMDLAFRAKHPDLAPELNLFMRDEKERWGELFTELFKVNSLAMFVTLNLSKQCLSFS
jgi:hypothetical protein